MSSLPKNSNRISKQILTLVQRPCPDVSENKQSFAGAVTSNSHEYAELEPAPEHFEEGVTITAETLIEIDLGDASLKQPIFDGSGLFENEKHDLIALLKNYKDCFAWSYDQMPGLSPKIALHHLSVSDDIKPIQQSKRKHNSALENQISAEIEKLEEVNFIREV